MIKTLKNTINLVTYLVILFQTAYISSQEKPNAVPPRTVSKHNLFVFISQDCKTCNTLIQKLKEKEVKFLEVDINGKNNLLSPVFWRKMKDQGYTRENIELPFAKTNKRLFYPIDDFDEFIEILKLKEKKGEIKVKRTSLF
ncbi:hypothetical protein GCM10009430_33850 [Aquimarina litoralis]|uniref:Glutaredoxin domain-containing protein n=1 Tax=Aquimarina litoralis TaxID=584605 RepID=A0ABN1J2C2_9FLAO